MRVTWSPTDSWELESSGPFKDSSGLRKKEQVEEASSAGGVTDGILQENEK